MPSLVVTATDKGFGPCELRGRHRLQWASGIMLENTILISPSDLPQRQQTAGIIRPNVTASSLTEQPAQ
jgi:hypothetical protein